MKKILSFLITAVCALTLFSCTVNSASTDNTPDTSTNSGSESGTNSGTDKEGGKEYYDSLYEAQASVREERRKNEEIEKGAVAANVVEAFKKNYVAAPEKEGVKQEEVKEDNRKKVSSEELKIAYLQGKSEKVKKEEGDSPTAAGQSDAEEAGQKQEAKPRKPEGAAMSAAEAVRMMKQKSQNNSDKEE